VDEFPIESSVDEFVDAILKATGDRVVCAACGNTEWASYDATPLTLNADNLRPGIPEDDTIIGFHVVPFACRRCGLVRFHAVNLVFPPSDENEG
jgi:ribosomal protein S27AE